MRKKIVIDLDNTIIDSARMVYELYAKDNQINKPYHTNFDWDFNGLINKNDLPKVLSYFIDKRLYDNFYEFDGSIRIINELAKNNDICIVTKHHKDRIPLTLEWVRKSFNNVKIAFVPTFDKGMFNGDIFIDDKSECLNSVKNNFKHIICFGDYKWNEEWKGIRFTNWSDIERYINNIK